MWILQTAYSRHCMKRERRVEFRCEECNRNVTDRKHVRIFMGFTSGWMAPPFHGGKPVAGLADRNPETHFCKPECFASYFTRKLHEINPNTARSAAGANVAPVLEQVLEELAAARSPVPGQTDVGARDLARWEAGQRDVGDSQALRVGTRGGRVAGRRRDEQGDQQVDSARSDNGLGGGRVEVSTDVVEAGSPVLRHSVRPWAAVRRALISVLP